MLNELRRHFTWCRTIPGIHRSGRVLQRRSEVHVGVSFRVPRASRAPYRESVRRTVGKSWTGGRLSPFLHHTDKEPRPERSGSTAQVTRHTGSSPSVGRTTGNRWPRLPASLPRHRVGTAAPSRGSQLCGPSAWLGFPSLGALSADFSDLCCPARTAKRF